MRTQKPLITSLLIATIACNFLSDQIISPSQTPSPPTSTQFITATPSPFPTDTPSPTLEPSERACAPGDFKTPIAPPDINQPETLIGVQSETDWSPPENWKFIYFSRDFDFKYSLTAYQSSDQFLFIGKKPICTYDENKKYLSEIKDYILVSDLQDNEVILQGGIFFAPSSYKENVSWRYNFGGEMHARVICPDEELYRAIMLARYNPDELPNKIGYEYQITLEVFRGWLPDVQTNEFIELPTTGLFCQIAF